MTEPDDGYALFLDFDGTLVAIAGRPEDVAVPSGLSGILADLRSRLGGALAIATGRPLRDVDGFLPGLRLDGCGLHGLERRVRGRVLPLELPPIAAEIDVVQRQFAGRSGVIVEDKRVGVGIHWRLAPDAEDEAREAIAAVARRLGPGYRVQDGKAVSEVVSVKSGKGAGIEALMGSAPFAGRIPIFAGDDRTDEDGFAAVNRLGGTTIKIGAGPTAASARVADPDAFREVLLRWSRHGIDVARLPGH